MSPSDLYEQIHDRNLPESWLVMALTKEADYFFSKEGSHYTVVALAKAKDLLDQLIRVMRQQEASLEAEVVQ